MKVTTVYATIWTSVALAATVGVIVTRSAAPLWILIIPMFMSLKGEDTQS